MDNSLAFILFFGKEDFMITTETDGISAINDIFSGKLFIRIHTTLFC